MNTKAIGVVFVVASAFSNRASAKSAGEIETLGSPEAKGQAVAQELSARNTGFKDMGGSVEMTLRDASGSEARRHFTLKLLEKPDAASGDYSLITFDSPADVKGRTMVVSSRFQARAPDFVFQPERGVRRIGVFVRRSDRE
jgi:hypothetical protein